MKSRVGARVNSRVAIAAFLLTPVTVVATGCAIFGPTGPSNQEAQFCVTQNEGESLLCCPSPGIGCQAAEATQ